MKTVLALITSIPILFGAAEALIEGRWLTLTITFAVMSAICFVAAILRIKD